MRRLSLSSVVIKSANREEIAQAVASYVARLRKQHPEIERVISSSQRSPRDRIPDYLPVGFPVGIDLFAYTQAEFVRLRETSPGWYEAIASGREI
jgi:hypothetical protein